MTSNGTQENQNSQNEQWYARPVFSVSSVEDSLRHYCELLGFEQGWKYEEQGQIIVTQVSKGGFELILTSNLDRVGQARVFVSLTASELEELKTDIERHQITTSRIHWGYPTIRISDPDGNELFFPLEE